uniref:Uncharacterized protein n=1 Tax=Myoviridae sp. ctdNl2 TaxID=2825140 RepID=A0A8S5QI60_9CAUD|nr:MAG TPA: hypothetical protein [Myoviridae sp. ctdNl2]
MPTFLNATVSTLRIIPNAIRINPNSTLKSRYKLASTSITLLFNPLYVFESYLHYIYYVYHKLTS